MPTLESYAIHAAEIFAEDGIQKDACLLVAKGKILGVACVQEARARNLPILEREDTKILPGLFDSHIHGSMGCDTMEATAKALDTMGTHLASVGTTSWMPTTVTETLEKIEHALQNVAMYHPPKGAAKVFGSFVEGPYLTAEHRGAHPAALLRELSLSELDNLLATGAVRALAVAPEKTGADSFIRAAVAKGVHISMAHSSATYEEARLATEAGADAVTHTYNGMGSLHHREPGLLGEAMTDNRLYAELIADGIHVRVPAMDILRRCKPKDKLILISDAIAAAGLRDGIYKLGEERVTVKNSIARTDNGSLAGSTTYLLAEVRRMIQEVGEHPLHAVHMASWNPAKRYGLDSEIGSLRRGKCADFLVVDENYHLLETYINGSQVFSAPHYHPEATV